MDVRHARADERDEIAHFMHASFPRAKWGLDKWRELLAGRWADPEDPFAIIARSGDTLVGALGLISVNRPLENGGVAKTRAATSPGKAASRRATNPCATRCAKPSG